MVTVNAVEDAPLRCATWTREQEVDPIGSVGSPTSFLVVEWPLPWPQDIGQVPALADLGPDLARTGCRLQGVVAPGDRPERRVVHYYRPSGPFQRLARDERLVDAAEVVTTARRMLNEEPPADPAPLPEVLICTHGRRDRCCGSFGTELALQLLADPDQLGPSVRVGRTSHTGGHRFAPTAIVFPEATGWAFASIDLLSRVVNRRGPVSDVLDHYRGCAGLDTPQAQVVERAVLGEVGWDLFERPRWSSTGADGTVRLHVQDGDRTDVWEASVTPGRVLPVPECGSPLVASRKTSTEYVLTGLKSS